MFYEKYESCLEATMIIFDKIVCEKKSVWVGIHSHCFEFLVASQIYLKIHGQTMNRACPYPTLQPSPVK